MTFFNYFSQFNIDNWSGFSNMFSPQWSFFAQPNFFDSWFSFNNNSSITFNNNVWTNYIPEFNWNTNFDTFTYQTSKNPTNRIDSGFKFKSNHIYANLSRQEALNKAQNDTNLERLSGGRGWQISTSSFTNDIPYARKGTGVILSKVSEMIGQNLTITSALGTKNSPHVKSNGSASHYNSSNPKLDIGGGLSANEAYKLKTKLINTGYFSRVEVETHGSTAHLDIQIKDSAFTNLESLA